MSGCRAGCPVAREAPDVRVGRAGCPVLLEGPDVWCIGRMSGLSGPSSEHSGCHVRISGREAGFQKKGRMSGLYAVCPVAVVSSTEGWPCRSPGAGCPGSWSDVRCLEAAFAFSHWFFSSLDLGSWPSSCASSGGSSWYLIMHNIPD